MNNKKLIGIFLFLISFCAGLIQHMVWFSIFIFILHWLLMNALRYLYHCVHQVIIQLCCTFFVVCVAREDFYAEGAEAKVPDLSNVSLDKIFEPLANGQKQLILQGVKDWILWKTQENSCQVQFDVVGFEKDKVS